MTHKARRSTGFTIVELVVVIVIMGILGAIGVARFWDNSIFENRAYADQTRTVIRYAQKLAISQNRPIFVRADGNSFAVCSGAGCAANELLVAPGGSNSGSSASRARCQTGNGYVSTWMCEGRPDNVVVGGPTGVFFFDAMGRPYNAGDTVPVSSFAQMTLTFSSASNSAQIIIWPETGYVQ